MMPGEKFFGVLFEEAGKLVRRDYCVAAWVGAPEGALGFWQGKVTTGATPKKPPIDDELLLDCLARLEGQNEPARLSFRYVLALLLLRRKRFRLEEARQEGGREVLVLRCPRTGARHQVLDPGLTDEEMEAVQDDVFQALGWE